MQMIPRKFFLKKFDEWQSGGYRMIDFSSANVDMSAMPYYYQQRYAQIKRNIAKNYFLNHLIYHELARVEFINDTYAFKPDFITGVLTEPQGNAYYSIGNTYEIGLSQ